MDQRISQIYKALDAQHKQMAMQQTGAAGAQAYVASDRNPGKVAATYQTYLRSLSKVPTLASGVKQAIPRVMSQMGVPTDGRNAQ